MQLCDAVDLDAGNGGQERHPHRAGRVVGHDRHPAGAQLVVGVGLADLLEELVVDAVDDLEVAGQQASHQFHRPGLQRLGQQGVAGVGEALAGDSPGLVPVELLLVDEDAHQLGDGDHRVGVVQLEDDPLGQVVQVEVVLQHLLDEVAQRAGDEEVLLLQAQLLALRGGVLGVQHLGDVLRERLRPDGLCVVTGVEDRQVERLGCLRAPQPQRVHAAVLVAGNHVVVGDAQHVPAGDPAGAFGAVVVVGLGVTAELDLDSCLRVRELPWATERQPGVRLLHLAAVDERLAEDAVFVADAVADTGDTHRREGVDEAGGEPSEAAVAQSGLDLLGAEHRQVEPAGCERLLRDVVEVGGQQGIAELPSEQVLRGEVADGLRLG